MLALEGFGTNQFGTLASEGWGAGLAAIIAVNQYIIFARRRGRR